VARTLLCTGFDMGLRWDIRGSVSGGHVLLVGLVAFAGLGSFALLGAGMEAVIAEGAGEGAPTVMVASQAAETDADSGHGDQGSPNAGAVNSASSETVSTTVDHGVGDDARGSGGRAGDGNGNA